MRLLRLAAYLGLALFGGAGLGGCSKASEETQAKRISKPPPQEDERKPFSIPVTSDDAVVLVLDNAFLASKPPEFKDAERQAWELATLLPNVQAGTTVTAYDEQGTHLSFDWPLPDAKLRPVLMLSRRGHVAVTVIDNTEPFPEFHGQGNRLERRGDLRPRLQPVVKLAITRTAEKAAATAPAQTTPPPVAPGS